MSVFELSHEWQSLKEFFEELNSESPSVHYEPAYVLACMRLIEHQTHRRRENEERGGGVQFPPR